MKFSSGIFKVQWRTTRECVLLNNGITYQIITQGHSEGCGDSTVHYFIPRMNGGIPYSRGNDMAAMGENGRRQNDSHNLVDARRSCTVADILMFLKPQADA